mgnify:CR=1 FL=1
MIKKIGVIGNRTKPKLVPTVKVLEKACKERGVRVFVEEGLADLFQKPRVFTPPVPEDFDFVVAMGGDGTFLRAARMTVPREIPVLGVNLGSLGFLTEIQEPKLRRALSNVLSGDYVIEHRMVLEAQAEGVNEPLYAVNDVVVCMANVGRMITVGLYVDGEYVKSVSADGVIVSTPTGSTAYSLAAGGPIVFPVMEAIVFTPICPHTLAFRPIIFPSTKVVELEIQQEDAVMVVDGQLRYELHPKDRIRVIRASLDLKIVKAGESTFFEILRTKLHWG